MNKKLFYFRVIRLIVNYVYVCQELCNPNDKNVAYIDTYELQAHDRLTMN